MLAHLPTLRASLDEEYEAMDAAQAEREAVAHAVAMVQERLEEEKQTTEAMVAEADDLDDLCNSELRDELHALEAEVEYIRVRADRTRSVYQALTCGFLFFGTDEASDGVSSSPGQRNRWISREGTSPLHDGTIAADGSARRLGSSLVGLGGVWLGWVGGWVGDGCWGLAWGVAWGRGKAGKSGSPAPQAALLPY